MDRKSFKNARSLILCIAGIGINIILSKLVGFLGIPLYLDAVGTVIVAALSGYIPGIIVGLVTNIIKFFAGDAEHRELSLPRKPRFPLACDCIISLFPSFSICFF